jgi:hypothetical protein
MRRLTFQCIHCDTPAFRRPQDLQDHQAVCPGAVEARRKAEKEYNRIRSERIGRLFTISQVGFAEPR